MCGSSLARESAGQALVVAGDVDVLGVGFPQRPGDLGPQDRQDFPGLVAIEELGCRDERLGVLTWALSASTRGCARP